MVPVYRREIEHGDTLWVTAHGGAARAITANRAIHGRPAILVAPGTICPTSSATRICDAVMAENRSDGTRRPTEVTRGGVALRGVSQLSRKP